MSLPFLTDYTRARARFLDQAQEADAAITSHQHPLRGPKGEKLFMDAAVIGPMDARNALVLLSATHGVEGICGSGIQSQFLADRVPLPAYTLLLVVHAVNPHGFAWSRRVTEDGVDLNRNFIDFARPLPENPDYDRAVADALIPPDWFGEAKGDADSWLLNWAMERGGIQALATAVPRGQYVHPFAPFFGGHGAGWSNRTVRQVLKETLAGCTGLVAMIDYHTGLGENGTGQLIGAGAAGSSLAMLGRQAWGEAFVLPSDAGTVSYEMTGALLDAAADSLAPGARMIGGAHEFGTLSGPEVLEALRADHWLHTYGDFAADYAADIKHQVRAAFFDDSAAWRDSILERARVIQAQAITALRND
jgi:hypothetical protein